MKMSDRPKPSTSLANARVASKFGAGSTVWPRPMSPVTKRGTPWGDTNGWQSERWPQLSSCALPDGSVSVTSACTPRCSMVSALPACQATPQRSRCCRAWLNACSLASSQPLAR
ncbi:hypothetical protein D3C77_554130 [compost metagenome]